MASVVLCPASGQTVFRNGRPAVGAKVFFYNANTTTPKTVYVDSNLQAAHPHPILADGQGMIPPIYVGTGDYKYRVLSPSDVIIYEVDGLPGAAGATDGGDPGETYPLTDPTSILITGDIIAAYRVGSRAGFARCNGSTIGTAASGASEIAVGVPSSQVQPVGSAYPLFVYLWENAPNLPIYSSGVEVARGATAIADWDANRQLGLPDARGRAFMGLDGMGAPASNRLQLQRELTTTKGSLDAYVTDVSGIVAGMVITATGVMEGTTVKVVDGLKLTLSLPPTLTTSTSAHFSQFGDANRLGATGGESHYELTTGQLPPHKHDAASTIAWDGQHVHYGNTSASGDHQHSFTSMTFSGPGNIGAGAAVNNVYENRTTAPAGNHAHSFWTDPAGSHSHAATTTLEDTGEGQSYSAVPPAMLLTFYIKL